MPMIFETTIHKAIIRRTLNNVRTITKIMITYIIQYKAKALINTMIMAMVKVMAMIMIMTMVMTL
jgi:hypothetical protein